MNVLTSVGILVFSMLILAFLQLTPGIFAIFAHSMSGKYSRRKATDLITFFILGAETFTAVIFLVIYSFLCFSPAIIPIIDSDIFAYIIAGIFLALAIAIFCFYYRPGRGSKLFISRRLATQIPTKAPTIKTRSDAFVFGFSAAIPELIFTLPLYFISALTIMRLDLICPQRASIVILFALVSVLPLFIAQGHNLATILRFRFGHKSFIRFSLSLFYLLIAILIIMGVIL